MIQGNFEQDQENRQEIPIKRSIWDSDLIIKILKFKSTKYNATSVEVAFFILLKLFLPFHSFLTYALLTQNSLKLLIQNFLLAISETGVASVMVVSLLYAFKATLIFSICVLVWVGDKFIFHDFCKRIVSSYHIFVEVDLIVSSLLALTNFEQNIAGLVLAICLHMFSILFITNYFDRKDMLYVSSIQRYVILDVIVALSFLINAAASTLLDFKIYLLIDFVVSLALSYWLIFGGYLVIPNRTFYSYILNIILFKAANCIVFFQHFFTMEFFTITNYLIKFGIVYCIFLVVFYFLRSETRLYEKLRHKRDRAQVKDFDILLGSLLEEGSLDKQKQFLVVSTCNYHSEIGCGNAQCLPRSMYDPINRSHVSVVEEDRNRQASLKFYLRCIYRRSLQQLPGNTCLALDYCEFILNEFNNPYEICQLLRKLRQMDLGALDFLRISKLGHLLQDSNQAFNRILFEGKLDLEHMIVAQENFQSITNNIVKSVRLNLSIWNMICQDRINITLLKEEIKANFKVIDETNKKWELISQYLSLQKRWKYIFINYGFFILNKKLVHKETEEFKSLSEDSYFAGESIHLFENSHDTKLIDQRLLFDKKSFYIRAYLNERNLEILNVSKLFENYVEYTGIEIHGSPISLILPHDLKKIHQQKVIEWLEHGYCSNEEYFPPRFTSFLTRSEVQVKAVKFYKLFVNLYSEHLMEFVCLLKVNEPEEPELCMDAGQIETSKSLSETNINQEFRQSNKTILKSENNLFLKDENLKINETISEITQIKRAIRLNTFLISGLIIILLLVSLRDTDNLQSKVIQFLNFLNIYRFPMALGKNYMKLFLKVGNQTKVTNQIKSQTASVLQFVSDPLTLQTLFDQQLNVPNIYHPYQNDSFNEGLSYNQIEIYSVIVSSIVSLSKLPINRTDYNFKMLNMYLVPSYDHMVNSTKIRIHKNFQNTLSNMLSNQILVGAVEFSIFVAMIVFVCSRVILYFKKVTDIFKIIFEFNDSNVRKILKYWNNLYRHFQKLNFKNQVYGTRINLAGTRLFEDNLDIESIKFSGKNDQGIAFNKKNKVVDQNKKVKQRMRMIIIVVATALLLVIIGVLSVQLSNITNITNLSNFQQDGYYFLQYYPATSVLGHALLERYYSQLYPKEINYDPSRYEEYVSDMDLIGNAVYIGQTKDESFSYYLKQKNYMFGNPCTYNQTVLLSAQTTLTKCLTIYNKTFSNGITTFLRQAQPQIENYLRKKINLTATQLDELTFSLTMVAYYVTDAITTWSTQFSGLIVKFQGQIVVICSIATSLLILLHLILIEWLFFSYLDKDYAFMREIFDRMIPEYILSLQKIIKQKFIKQGIIKQS